MKVDVLLFASYADAVGAASTTVEIADGGTVRDVLRHVQALATATAVPARPMVAINQSYASLDDVVRVGDEIAIIPPVAGG